MTQHRDPQIPEAGTNQNHEFSAQTQTDTSTALTSDTSSVVTPFASPSQTLRLAPPSLDMLWLSSPHSRHPQTPPENISTETQESVCQRLVLGTVLADGKNLIQEAFDTNLQRSLVLKKLKPEQMAHPAEVRRLIEEAQITAQLDHPTVVPVHELGFDETNTLYFAMKHVRGQTLHASLLAQKTSVPTEASLFRWLQIFLRVCDAVNFAHSHGVIHRNIHPKNIMIGEYGEVYLMDWSLALHKGNTRPSDQYEIFPSDWEIARWMEQQQQQQQNTTAQAIAENTTEQDNSAQAFLPSPNRSQTDTTTPSTNARAFEKLEALRYLAPEQTRKDITQIDERTDIFSLGSVLYQIITGTPLYAGDSLPTLLFKASQCQIVPPHERIAHPLPPKLCQIVMKALSKEPNERFASVASLKQEIEQFLESGWQFPRHTFASGALIVREGDIGKEAYIILKGRCRVFRTIQQEKVELREMHEGDVFGETAVFTDQTRSASVEAIDEVTLAIVSARHFEEELGMGFWLGVFIKALAARFREKDARVLELERELQHLRQQK